MKEFIPVNEPNLIGNEKKYLQECIDSGWISSEGPFVKKLENQIAQLCNRKYAFAVCNGTAALELAVKSIGIKSGDEVILPTFTIISCALAITRSGATPVLVDADPETWNMQVNEIESLINEKTKAIMAVHIYGITVDMKPLLKIASKYNLKVIEDAAEVIGQKYDGKPCGSFGDVSTFSFYPNKHITTGEGGMILTDDPQVAEKCDSMRNLCFGKKNRFVHYEKGWNYRMSNLNAAVGLAQFEKLGCTVEKKREIGNQYHKALEGCSSLTLPLTKTNYCRNIYWVFGIVSNDKERTAQWWISKLAEYKIDSRQFFHPMHQQPCIKQNIKQGDSKFGNSELLSEQGLYLPSSTKVTEDIIDYISKIILKLNKLKI